jgi:hypothetical protein
MSHENSCTAESSWHADSWSHERPQLRLIASNAHAHAEAEDEESPLAEEFRRHANQWMRDTAKLSSTRDIALHPSYQRIMAMGPSALPLIFDSLKEQPHHWFWALRFITGEDPVKPEDLGKTRRTAEAWIEWGRLQGLTR